MNRFCFAIAFLLLALQPQQSDAQEAVSCLLEPARSITIAAAVPGILEEVAVRRGDRVEAGAEIARINSTVERAVLAAARFRATSTAAIRSAEARLEEARRQLAQVTSLADRGVASRNALAELFAQVAIAESIVAEARDVQEGARLDVLGAEAALEQLSVRAPVAGVILEQGPDVGEYAAPDLALAELVVVDQLTAEVLMPAETYRSVSEDAVITISDMSGAVSVQARLLAKDAVIDAASRTYRLSVEVDNADGRFISGTRCHIRFSE